MVRNRYQSHLKTEKPEILVVNSHKHSETKNHIFPECDNYKTKTEGNVLEWWSTAFNNLYNQVIRCSCFRSQPIFWIFLLKIDILAIYQIKITKICKLSILFHLSYKSTNNQQKYIWDDFTIINNNLSLVRRYFWTIQ